MTLMTRRAASRSHPSLQPPLTLQEETSSFPPSRGPSRRPLKAWPGGPVGPGGGQGRPLLYQEPPPGAGGREEETPPGLPVACSRGSPADQGLQVLSGGPDLRCFPTPSAPPPAPRGHCQGPPCCPSTPASSLAGRGGDPGGLALQFGSHRKLGGLVSSSLPHGLHPAQWMSPWPAQPVHWAGGLWSGLQPGSLQGPEVARAELDSGCPPLTGGWASALPRVAWGRAKGTGSDPFRAAAGLHTQQQPHTGGKDPGTPPRGAPGRPRTMWGWHVPALGC